MATPCTIEEFAADGYTHTRGGYHLIVGVAQCSASVIIRLKVPGSSPAPDPASEGRSLRQALFFYAISGAWRGQLSICSLRLLAKPIKLHVNRGGCRVVAQAGRSRTAR